MRGCGEGLIIQKSSRQSCFKNAIYPFVCINASLLKECEDSAFVSLKFDLFNSLLGVTCTMHIITITLFFFIRTSKIFSAELAVLKLLRIFCLDHFNSNFEKPKKTIPFTYKCVLLARVFNYFLGGLLRLALFLIWAYSF